MSSGCKQYEGAENIHSSVWLSILPAVQANKDGSVDILSVKSPMIGLGLSYTPMAVLAFSTLRYALPDLRQRHLRADPHAGLEPVRVADPGRVRQLRR